MLNRYLFAALALAFIITSTSCTRLTPTGNKGLTYSKMPFLPNKYSVTKAKSYKRYLNYHRR